VTRAGTTADHDVPGQDTDGRTGTLRRRAGQVPAPVLALSSAVVLVVAVLALAVRFGVAEVGQAVVDGARLGLVLALVGMGLSLVLATTGVFNFAHGEFATLGALTAWFLNAHGAPLWLAVAAAVPIGALAGVASERGVWRPLRRRRVSLVSVLVVGIGLGLATRSLFLFFLGGSARTYSDYAVQSPVHLLGVAIAPKSVVGGLVCLLALAALGLFLTRTRTGQRVRAVADDPSLAAASGIAVDRVLAAVWVIGGGLAALGGALLGLSEQVSWDMGNQVLLLVIAGVTLGGLGSVTGAAVGGLLVGVLTQLGVLFLPAELKYVTALALLVLILLVRPSGLFGRRERVG